MYIHFVDFEKAFDSVHTDCLWNIMNAYGIPRKIVPMVKALYGGFQCAVLDEGEKTEWFNITSFVKQGCVHDVRLPISPINTNRLDREEDNTR